MMGKSWRRPVSHCTFKENESKVWAQIKSLFQYTALEICKYVSQYSIVDFTSEVHVIESIAVKSGGKELDSEK